MGWNPGKSFSIARSRSLSTLAPWSLYCLLSVFCQITDASEEEKLSRPFLSWCYDPSGHLLIVLRPHSCQVVMSRACGGFSWQYVISLPFSLMCVSFCQVARFPVKLSWSLILSYCQLYCRVVVSVEHFLSCCPLNSALYAVLSSEVDITSTWIRGRHVGQTLMQYKKHVFGG